MKFQISDFARLVLMIISKQLGGNKRDFSFIPLSEIELQYNTSENMADEEVEAKSNVSSLLAAAKSNEKAEVKRLLLAKTNPDCCDEV